jgi:hypothetical protein
MNSEPLLPFSFAKEFNVLLEKEDENNILHCTTPPKRYCAAKFKVTMSQAPPIN